MKFLSARESVKTSPPIQWSGGKAFSLVEVAISLGVVSFVLLALLGLLSVGLDAGKSSREDTIIAGLCLATLAELKATPYADLPSNVSTYFTYDGRATNSAAGPYYQCTVEISDPRGLQTNSNFSKRVKIEIAWPAASSNRQTNLFETHLAVH